MDKVKQRAYLLIVLGIIFITISFIIGGPVLDSTLINFNGSMNGIQIILEILYYALNFAAFICVIVAIIMLIKIKDNPVIKTKEIKSNEKTI